MANWNNNSKLDSGKFTIALYRLQLIYCTKESDEMKTHAKWETAGVIVAGGTSSPTAFLKDWEQRRHDLHRQLQHGVEWNKQFFKSPNALN